MMDGEPMQRATEPAPPRAIPSVVLGVLAVGLLASGTCVVHSHHCFDADGDGRCDSRHPEHETSAAAGATDGPWADIASAPPELFRIERYTLLVAREADVARTLRLADARDVSMLRVTPRPAFDARSVRTFGDRVLQANERLLGLDAQGRWRLEGISALGRGLRLDYAAGPTRRVHLALDRSGNLVAVVSATASSPAHAR